GRGGDRRRPRLRRHPRRCVGPAQGLLQPRRRLRPSSDDGPGRPARPRRHRRQPDNVLERSAAAIGGVGVIAFECHADAMTLWKFYCMEDAYPGMWPRWFLNQCVGVGWYSGWGCSLDGNSDSPNWSRARNALKRIKVGDHIIVSLKNQRVGRVGEVTGKAVGDSDWNPLVPRTASMPGGEMGRRI